MQQTVEHEKSANGVACDCPYVVLQACDKRDNHGKYRDVCEKEHSLTCRIRESA